jgi:hypothetical protein
MFLDVFIWFDVTWGLGMEQALANTIMNLWVP